jgi:AAA15 family ATPase/GTPase
MGDTSKHLTYFKVENFKRFESFEMKELGQFNLIVGDNNVGKTSVLEALLVYDDAWFFFNRLLTSLKYRKIRDVLQYGDLDLYANRSFKFEKNTHSIIFNCSYFNSKKQIFSIEFQNKQKIIAHGFSIQNLEFNFLDKSGINPFVDIPFIPFYKGHDSDLTSFYSKLQENKSLKRNFTNSLKTIVPDLEDIELSSPYPDSIPHLIVYQKHSESSLPLAMFGDGTIKLFRLLAEIVLNKGERLMVDEIDTGIYFDRFKQFWKAILQTAKEHNVQLFMTTHSEECLKYFKEVLEEDMPELQKDARSITLVENAKTKMVTAHTYDFEQFEHAFSIGNEVRA